MRERAYSQQLWIRRARLLVIVELTLSAIFAISILSAVRRHQIVNLLLVIVILLNFLLAARLLNKLHCIKCASSIIVYVIWKIIQEIIMLPVLVILSFIQIDKYINSWQSSNTAIQLLVIVWSYLIYSFLLIIFLGWLTRRLWKQQSYRPKFNQFDDTTKVSIIDSLTDDVIPLRTVSSELQIITPYDNDSLPFISI